MARHSTRVASLIPSLLLALFAIGQEEIAVFGVMKEMDSGETLDRGRVKVIDMLDSTFILATALDGNGQYALTLPYDRQLLVHFDSPGMVGKQLVIDTRGVSNRERKGGHGMMIEVTCLTPVPGVDYRLVAEHPFGIARFDHKTLNFMWDMRYDETQRDAQRKLLEEHRAKRKELGRNSRLSLDLDQPPPLVGDSVILPR